MGELRSCFLCGHEAEMKKLGRPEYVRCPSCNLHYSIEDSAKILIFDKGLLNNEDKKRLITFLKKNKAKKVNSEKFSLITADLIKRATGKTSTWHELK
jgi:hypothetical protein